MSCASSVCCQSFTSADSYSQKRKHRFFLTNYKKTALGLFRHVMMSLAGAEMFSDEIRITAHDIVLTDEEIKQLVIRFYHMVS